MRLFFKCLNCNSANILSKKATNRSDLAVEIGFFTEVTCKKCNTDNTIHINKIHAKESPLNTLFVIMGLLIAIILNIGTLWYLWDSRKMSSVLAALDISFSIIVIPIIIAAIIQREDRKATKLFNNHYV